MLGWARPARFIRGVVLSAKERGYILAARSFGASDLYLLRRHVLPETRSIVLTQAALLIPQYVLAEVTLSFNTLETHSDFDVSGSGIVAMIDTALDPKHQRSRQSYSPVTTSPATARVRMKEATLTTRPPPFWIAVVTGFPFM